ncbi:MAG: cystathionine gamma-synthase family protein [Actinobacteria bacterium]|nr:cystathionine gamma-synthase family protein [Actinomycetota bacterium]MBU1494686.1 cystathionine gamma-synthase family protein [Actinomycetota bacterium]
MSKWKDEIDGKRLRPESLMMTYGYRPEWSEGAAKSPIFQTSTFVFETAEQGKRFFEVALGKVEPEEGEKTGLIYSRLNNPDIEIAEDRLTLWDEAEDAALFISGMAAISTTLLTYLRPGDLLVASEPIYGGSHHLIEHILPEFGIEVLRFDCRATEAELETMIAAAEGEPGAFFIETPSNPTNDLIDVAMCARVAAKHRSGGRPVPLAVDNTFLGPLFCHPLQHGADIVLYSATKFIGGHSDLIAGAAVGSMEMIEPIRKLRTILGSHADPWTAWLIQRSLETLQLRMIRQQETAGRVADFLREHPKVDKVLYLGHLEAGHPQYELYKRQCLGPGSMIAFEVPGGEQAAYRFLNNLPLIKLAVSLGSTESLAEHPKTMTHSEASAEDCDAMGVTDGLVRLSIGVEHPDDLIQAIGKALKAV